jgi:hypothetical protein
MAVGVGAGRTGWCASHRYRLRVRTEKSLASMSKELEKNNQQLYCICKIFGFELKTADA